MELAEVVADFASALKIADSRRPQAINARSKKPFKPGIGPHSESATIELVCHELERAYPAKYQDRLATSIPYPGNRKQKCDLCFGKQPSWEWAVEVKMLRMLGDNGKANDNILMHILSPYPRHRSALTDCEKLAASGFTGRRAILIYAYEAADWPVDPAVRAFVNLAASRVKLGPEAYSTFTGLVHPVHSTGSVHAWQVEPRVAA